MATKSNPTPSRRTTPPEPPSANNSVPIATQGPQFGEPAPTADPTKFTVKHGSDAQAYKILDSQKGTLKPRPFPHVEGIDEPVLTFAQALGNKRDQIVSEIQRAGQIVFHTVGDTGNTKGPKEQERVADKMVSDYEEGDSKAVPSFLYHLGDVVYSFGEAAYYYDQFYDPFRNYPAPIFAVPGNHDGMVAPNSSTETLRAFLDNFCATGQPCIVRLNQGDWCELRKSSRVYTSLWRHRWFASWACIVIAWKIPALFPTRTESIHT